MERAILSSQGNRGTEPTVDEGQRRHWSLVLGQGSPQSETSKVRAGWTPKGKLVGS